MNPSAPRPGDGGEPAWPPPDTGQARGATERPEPPVPPAPTAWGAEQPTSQLPRRPDTVRFPYPAPDDGIEPAPQGRPAEQPRYEPAPYGPPGQQPRYEPAPNGPPGQQPRYEPAPNGPPGQQPRYEPAPRDQGQEHEARWEQAHFDQVPYVQTQYDQAQYDQAQYDQAQYDQAQYDQARYGEAQDDRAAHNQAQSDQGLYEPAPFGQVPYDQDNRPTDPEFDVRGVRSGSTPASPDDRYQPSPRGSHLPPYAEPFRRATGAAAQESGAAAGAAGGAGAAAAGAGAGADQAMAGGKTTGASGGRRTGPRKLTVTRVAAFRSRELTTRGVEIFQRAAAADGADRSGLTHLTYAVMGNYAVDAALAVALANTLFFAAATAESTSKVLLYLLITVAPFAVIAPLIGPALDKLQHGRRIALGASSFARALLAVVMALNFDSWILYPCALGMLVLSKSFSVLKAAITPRVLPPDITLVKTNSRLTVFGLIAGGVAGALAAGLSWAFGSTGALFFTAVLSVVGGWLCLRIPSWVESTAGEIPVDGVGPKAKRAFPLSVTTTLWANGTIRLETGFLALFIAFVIKSEYTESSGFTQLLLLGVVGAAAGIGGFVGNGLGARLTLSKPETVSLLSLAATAVATLTAVLVPGLGTAALVGLVGSTASSLAKVCLDSVIQHELPEASRASAFGLSETVLQLSWVFGGVIGLLIGGVWSFGQDSVYSIGFLVITVLLLIGLVQSWLVRSGRSLFPWLDYSKLTRHFRRGRRTPVDGTAGSGRSGRKSRAARDAGQPPTAAWPAAPGQPPGSWQGGPPSGQRTPDRYGPPTGYGPSTQYQPRPADQPPTGYGQAGESVAPMPFTSHAPEGPAQYGPAQYGPAQYGSPQYRPAQYRPAQYGPARNGPPSAPLPTSQSPAAGQPGGPPTQQPAVPPTARRPPREAGKPRKGTP